MPKSRPCVYLDVCALCRPYDDQSQIRIRLETDAIQLILSHVRSGELLLVISPAHDVEINAIVDVTGRQRLVSLLRQIGSRLTFDLRQARDRAEQLVRRGLGLADAAHLAFALEAKAAFITCDDRLLRQCRRIGLDVWFGTPEAFCDEENLR